MQEHIVNSTTVIYNPIQYGWCLQAFARLSAVYGGTYMLSKPDAKVMYEGGVAVGVTSEGETAQARLVVGDPSYFPDKVQKASRVRIVSQMPSCVAAPAVLHTACKLLRHYCCKGRCL